MRTWFDGYAQFGESPAQSAASRVPGRKWCWITGDATEAYRPEVGLKRLVRHLLFLKPDVLIVADEVELNSAGKLELLFHTEHPASIQADGSSGARGERSALRAELLTPGSAKLEPGTISIGARHPESQKGWSGSLLRLTAESASLQTVVAFSACPLAAEPEKGDRPPRRFTTCLFRWQQNLSFRFCEAAMKSVFLFVLFVSCALSQAPAPAGDLRRLHGCRLRRNLPVAWLGSVHSGLFQRPGACLPRIPPKMAAAPRHS